MPNPGEPRGGALCKIRRKCQCPSGALDYTVEYDLGNQASYAISPYDFMVVFIAWGRELFFNSQMQFTPEDKKAFLL